MPNTQAAQPTAKEGRTPPPHPHPPASDSGIEWVYPVHWGSCQVSSQEEIQTYAP